LAAKFKGNNMNARKRILYYIPLEPQAAGRVQSLLAVFAKPKPLSPMRRLFIFSTVACTGRRADDAALRAIGSNVAPGAMICGTEVMVGEQYVLSTASDRELLSRGFHPWEGELPPLGYRPNVHEPTLCPACWKGQARKLIEFDNFRLTRSNLSHGQ
jgi:hypothetical protein